MSQSTNPRGIPPALFIENLNEFVKNSKESPDTLLTNLQESLSKYKFMMGHLEQRQKSIMAKIPEIKKSIESVALISANRTTEMTTRFELNDTLYADAVISPTNTVYLWLGAGILMAYPIEEANTLLSDKLNAANENIEQLGQDIGFLREQITTVEVTMARIYNYTVKQRKSLNLTATA